MARKTFCDGAMFWSCLGFRKSLIYLMALAMVVLCNDRQMVHPITRQVCLKVPALFQGGGWCLAHGVNNSPATSPHSMPTGFGPQTKCPRTEPILHHIFGREFDIPMCPTTQHDYCWVVTEPWTVRDRFESQKHLLPCLLNLTEYPS